MSGGRLDIRVDIAPGAAPDGDPDLWVWRDISSYRRQRADIHLNVGRDDESEAVEPADSSLELNLRDGLLSPRNPLSELYGSLGPNTPIRYRLPIFSDDFSRTEPPGEWGTATSGQEWEPSPSLSVSGGVGRAALAAANTALTTYVHGAGAMDLDVVYAASIDAVTLTQPWISALQLRRKDQANQYRVMTEFKPGGVVNLKFSKRLNSVNFDLGELPSPATYSPGTTIWTRAQIEGSVIRARTWSGALGDEPDEWHLSVEGANEIEATDFGFFQWRLGGNTNPGTLTVSIDDMTVHAILWTGTVPEWNPRWDKSGRDATAPIAAAGPMRRMIQGKDPLESPLARQLPRYGPGGYWPLEDGADSTSAGSALPGGLPARVADVTFGDDDAPPGASSSVRFNSSASYLRGRVTGNTTGAWSGLIFIKLATLPASDTDVIQWTCSSGQVGRYVVRANATGFVVQAYNSDGASLGSKSANYIVPPTEWTAIQLETNPAGGNVVWSFIWNRVGQTTFWAITDTISFHTSGRLDTFYVPGSTALVDARFCHAWAGPETLPFVAADYLAVASGYAGELASDRISRLCAEQGFRVAVAPGDSEPLGVQRAGQFLDLLRECAAADGGLLYERSGALAYTPRSARYNEPVAMVLDWSGGELAEAPQPTDDDQRLFTHWTVSRVGGSSAVHESAEAVAKHGRIRTSEEINIATDRRLIWHAMWRTALTTIDEMRWPSVTINLLAHPHLIPAFLGLRPGSRIQIANPKSQVPGISIDLFVEGISQAIGRNHWVATLACSPASPWVVGTWSSARWSASTTTVQADVAGGTTTFNITTASRWEIWSTTESGYQWDLAGETVTVQSVAAATGTGPYVQSVTVLRAQNGVSKTIPAGTPVKMVSGARWAL